MNFTVFKTANGWLVLRGEHSYLSAGDIPKAYVFNGVQALAHFLQTATSK